MFEPAILLKGPFRIADFAVEIVGQDWQSHPDYDRAVAVEWERRARRAAELGDHLWDGISYRVANHDAWSNPPRLELGTVAYRYLATYRRLHETHRAHGLEPLHHLSIAALLRTSDDHYLFGRRRVRGNIDLIGGGVQPDEMTVADGADLERSLLKEIREETGIQATQIAALDGLGVVLSTISNIIIVAHAALALTRAEAESAFAHREEDEMGALECVQAAQIKPYLRNLTDYRVLLAELLP
jgi:8-oxo-dGTP pyrophosphatase MutT (NUDIX family)